MDEERLSAGLQFDDPLSRQLRRERLESGQAKPSLLDYLAFQLGGDSVGGSSDLWALRHLAGLAPPNDAGQSACAGRSRIEHAPPKTDSAFVQPEHTRGVFPKEQSSGLLR